jgi:hypothetical protein
MDAPVAAHRVGWATVTTQQKYHHYDAKGLTRCGYRRKKGELSYADRPASLSTWQCCSTCDSIIQRTDEPAETTGELEYTAPAQSQPKAARRQAPVASFGYRGQADYEAQHALGAFDADGYELRRSDKVMLAPDYAKGNERVGTIESILYHPVSEKRRPDVEVSFPQSARLKRSKGTWLDTHLLLSHQARPGRLRLEQPGQPATTTPTIPEPLPKCLQCSASYQPVISSADAKEKYCGYLCEQTHTGGVQHLADARFAQDGAGREGWASTDPGHTKYHHYGPDGKSKCNYQKNHGPLHFAPNASALLPSECCSACDLHLLKAKQAKPPVPKPEPVTRSPKPTPTLTQLSLF